MASDLNLLEILCANSTITNGLPPSISAFESSDEFRSAAYRHLGQPAIHRLNAMEFRLTGRTTPVDSMDTGNDQDQQDAHSATGSAVAEVQTEKHQDGIECPTDSDDDDQSGGRTGSADKQAVGHSGKEAQPYSLPVSLPPIQCFAVTRNEQLEASDVAQRRSSRIAAKVPTAYCEDSSDDEEDSLNQLDLWLRVARKNKPDGNQEILETVNSVMMDADNNRPKQTGPSGGILHEIHTEGCKKLMRDGTIYQGFRWSKEEFLMPIEQMDLGGEETEWAGPNDPEHSCRLWNEVNREAEEACDLRQKHMDMGKPYILCPYCPRELAMPYACEKLRHTRFTAKRHLLGGTKQSRGGCSYYRAQVEMATNNNLPPPNLKFILVQDGVEKELDLMKAKK